MPTFDITAPDGKVYEIEGANAEGALAALQKHLGAASAQSTVPAATPQMEAAPTYDAMGNPTQGQVMQPVQASMSYGDQMARVGGALDKGVRLAANGMTFGLADKFAGGMDSVTGQAPSYDAGVKAQRARTEDIRKENPGAATAAEAAGGLVGGAGLIKNGITLAGRFGPGLLARVLGYGGEGAVYGALHGAGNTYSDKGSDYIEAAKQGATTGALIGGALPILGTAAGGIYRGGSAFLGPRIEGAGRGASTLLRSAAMADEAGIQSLSRMGPEAMLVDAGPAMLGLGQGAGTGTGAGRTALVDALRARDAGTGQRLAQTLDDVLGPSPIPSRLEAGLQASRDSLSPAYQQVLGQAAPVNTGALAQQLDVLATAERGGAQRAAQNIRGMLDDVANPGQLDQNPATLLNTRHAIDGMLATEVDPNTIRILTQSRGAVDDELARTVPGIKDVDAQFAELSRQSGGLTRGGQVFDTGKTATRPAELAQEIAEGALPQGTQIGPSAAPMRMRQGARAEIDRIVGTQVNDLNALERTLATPQDWNSQKFAQVFGEGPRGQVAEALMNNRQFRSSYQNIVQNSQTAQRQEAAKAMRGSEGGNVPHDLTLTGIGFKALNAVAKAISGASNSSTKNEIGQILSAQGPEVGRIARELLQSARTANRNSDVISRIVGSQRWISATAPVADRPAKR